MVEKALVRFVPVLNLFLNLTCMCGDFVHVRDDFSFIILVIIVVIIILKIIIIITVIAMRLKQDH